MQRQKESNANDETQCVMQSLSDMFYFLRSQQVGCHSRGMFVGDRNCLSKSHPLLLRVCRSL